MKRALHEDDELRKNDELHEDEDQTPWEAPGPQGFIRGPFEDDAAEWPPERLGEDRQSRLARRTVFFVIVMGLLALVPVIGLLLRLRR